MSYETYENDHVTVGPWGGQIGARWDDGVFSSVKQVVISHGAAIDSIQVEYDKNGFSVWSDKHGGTGGFKTNKVKFNHPDEFLVSISGCYGSIVDYGPVLVLSLTLSSNKKKYGPFGIPQGTHFSFPMTGGMVVGFHGRSSWSLDSIGVHLKPFLTQNPSNNFTASPNYASTGITEKTKGSEIAMVREKQDNMFVPNRGFHHVEAKDNIWDNPKNYQSEIMIHKSGYSGSTILKGTTVVKSVTVHTNRGTSGPLGSEQGIMFTSGSNDGIISGFSARNGRIPGEFGEYVVEGKPPLLQPFNELFADRFGAHVVEGKPLLPRPFNKRLLDGFGAHTVEGKQSIPRPFNERFADNFGAHVIKGNPSLPRPFNERFTDGFGAHVVQEKPPLPGHFNDSFKPTDRELCQVFPGKMKELARFSSGPWGGNGGRRWDDGVFSGVKKIFLYKGEVIYSIQIEYDRNGQSVLSAKHGGGSEGSSHTITFQYPHEVLTGFCGYYESLTGDEVANVVKSLTFYTNKGKYGPFGEEKGTFFSSSKTEGKIVGFHGKSGCYLNSIGVHMQV